jgi:hypothetical protein
MRETADRGPLRMRTALGFEPPRSASQLREGEDPSGQSPGCPALRVRLGEPRASGILWRGRQRAADCRSGAPVPLLPATFLAVDCGRKSSRRSHA